jgi:GNAT superfamily N-acetyltransferase
MQTPSTSTTVYHLEMCDRKALRPKVPPSGFDVSMITPPTVELNRQMYQSVGEPWEWTDRLQWSDDKWHRYVHRTVLETWVGRLQGQTVGFFELEIQDDGNVEIAYFGLLPEFIGQGLGGPLLTAAVERAWQMPETRRVWVHTCTKDHEHAIDNYRQRGFEVFKTERV